MRDHYAKQYGSRSRSLCLKEANAAIPLNKYGRPTYPENVEINGYVNQYYIAKAAGEQKAPKDIHALISAKRRARKVDPPKIWAVRRAVKGTTHLRDRTETRGRKPKMTPEARSCFQCVGRTNNLLPTSNFLGSNYARCAAPSGGPSRCSPPPSRHV